MASITTQKGVIETEFFPNLHGYDKPETMQAVKGHAFKIGAHWFVIARNRFDVWTISHLPTGLKASTPMPHYDRDPSAIQLYRDAQETFLKPDVIATMDNNTPHAIERWPDIAAANQAIIDKLESQL